MKQFVLTLNGAVQALSTLFTSGLDDVPLYSIHLQPDGANANPVYIGASSSVSSSSYGTRLPAASGGIPPAPYIFENSGALRLSDLFVLGTNGEKLHVLGLMA